MNSGLGLWASNYKTPDGAGIAPKLMTYGVDSERNVGRFRLNGDYVNADKTAGVSLRFQVQGDGDLSSLNDGDSYDSANTPVLAYAYAWGSFFKNVLNIKAGLVDDTFWQTTDVIFLDDQNEGPGALFRLTPVKGLDFGVGAYTGSFGHSDNNNFLPDIRPFAWDKAKYTFYGSYMMDNVFRFMASYRTYNEVDNSYYSALQRSQILAELRILAVPKLTAVIVGQVVGIQAEGANFNGTPKADPNNNWDNSGQIAFYETLGYKVGAFGFGINAAQYSRNGLANDKNAPTDLALRFNPWINYALKDGKIVPRLDLVYFMGGLPTKTGNSGPRLDPDYNTLDGGNYYTAYQRRAFTAMYDNSTYVINARPSVKFFMDPKTSFEIGDAVYYYQAAKSSAGVKPDPVLNNAFYIDMVVSF